MSKEEVKKIVKDVYNEDPVSFKQDFENIIKSRILDKINNHKSQILDSMNSLSKPTEDEE